jgi:uncharacterized YigZ family protein
LEYITLSKEAEVSFIEKKSEFIGHAAPVKTEEEAMEYINKIRKRYGDATHNCYAYMLANGSARYSDDGEPQGTAGVPILSVIQKGGFTDAVIVVTRYFGGILLGAGGLVRAYSASARDAVAAAKIVTYAQYSEFRVRCSYSEYQKLIPLIERLGVKEDGSEFTDAVTLHLAAKPEIFKQFSEKLSEMSGGKLIAEETGSRFSE